MTVINEMFGVKGVLGSLCVEPKLLAQQFDEECSVRLALAYMVVIWEKTAPFSLCP